MLRITARTACSICKYLVWHDKFSVSSNSASLCASCRPPPYHCLHPFACLHSSEAVQQDLLVMLQLCSSLWHCQLTRHAALVFRGCSRLSMWGMKEGQERECALGSSCMHLNVRSTSSTRVWRICMHIPNPFLLHMFFGFFAQHHVRGREPPIPPNCPEHVCQGGYACQSDLCEVLCLPLSIILTCYGLPDTCYCQQSIFLCLRRVHIA